jgi:Ca-activated chloride channel family protein
MEQLADKGNGNYAYIDSLAEARKVLVSQANATLVTVAKDVKIQVEFNPAQVSGYRLLGYENRSLNAQDFNNDAKDAGEMGQGHAVTALYELVPAGQPVRDNNIDPLRYQQERQLSADSSQEIAHLKVRYKAPQSEVSQLLEQTIESPQELKPPQGDLAFASAVAAFGMVLRQSPCKGSSTYADIRRWAADALGPDTEGYRAQFLELVELAQRLPAQ